jgi:hypothetical protein
MNINDWKNLLKSCKKSMIETGTYDARYMSPAKVGDGRRYWILVGIKEDTLFGKKVQAMQNVLVRFHEPQERLTIFEGSLLHMIGSEEKIPHDYASYHKCVAGERFINNIKSIEKQPMIVKEVEKC